MRKVRELTRCILEENLVLSYDPPEPEIIQHNISVLSLLEYVDRDMLEAAGLFSDAQVEYWKAKRTAARKNLALASPQPWAVIDVNLRTAPFQIVHYCSFGHCKCSKRTDAIARALSYPRRQRVYGAISRLALQLQALYVCICLAAETHAKKTQL